MEGNLDARERAVALEGQVSKETPYCNDFEHLLSAGSLCPDVLCVFLQRKHFPKGIPECGTDALRFALCSYKAQGK